MTRFHRAIAWLCLVCICLAVVVPAVSEHFSLVLPAVWILFVPVLLVAIGVERASAGVQGASLRSSVPPRAPPVPRSLI
jgi:hypothetical protein